MTVLISGDGFTAGRDSASSFARVSVEPGPLQRTSKAPRSRNACTASRTIVEIVLSAGAGASGMLIPGRMSVLSTALSVSRTRLRFAPRPAAWTAPTMRRAGRHSTRIGGTVFSSPSQESNSSDFGRKGERSRKRASGRSLLIMPKRSSRRAPRPESLMLWASSTMTSTSWAVAGWSFRIRRSSFSGVVTRMSGGFLRRRSSVGSNSKAGTACSTRMPRPRKSARISNVI